MLFEHVDDLFIKYLIIVFMTFLRLHISIFKIQIIFSCFIQDLKLVLIMNLRNIFQHFNDYFTIFNPKDKKKV